MEFNGSPRDLIELSALLTNDARVIEAAVVAQKLSKLELVICSYILGSVILSTNSHDELMQFLSELRNIPVKLGLIFCRI